MPKQPLKATMPPVSPPVATQARAGSLEDVGSDWIIIAVRPNGKGEWEPTMPYEQYRLLRHMKADGAYATAQRRDPVGTVLLAKLKVD